jgi:hypothetical protein
MSMMRVAFAGLSPLREDIVRDALARAGNFQVVEPWTSLHGAVRAMLAAASGLRIVALSVDASWARVFELREHQTVIMKCVADDLCAAISAASRPPRIHAV